MYKIKQRVAAWLVALAVLLTTCFAGLPEGSLSILSSYAGAAGSVLASLFESSDVEASTTKITLSKQYSKYALSEIGRAASEGLYFFNTGSGSKVFCMNSGKALSKNDTYSSSSIAASGYSDQKLAKAMTWYFKTLSGGSYSTLSASQTRAAVQAYVWAECTSGASVSKTVAQALTNYGVSGASSMATKICDAISGTSVSGTIYIYTCSTCGGTHSGGKKSISAHQTMIGYVCSKKEPTIKSYSTSMTDSLTEWMQVGITKTAGGTTATYKVDTATFQVLLDGKKLANCGTVKKDGSSGGYSASGVYGTYDSSKSTFTTSGGIVRFFLKRTYTSTKTSSTYYYVYDWGDYSSSEIKAYCKTNGCYLTKAEAIAAAKEELSSATAAELKSLSTETHTWTVKETAAPTGFAVSKETQTGTETTSMKSSSSLSFTFTDNQKYLAVTVQKTRRSVTGLLTGSVATLQGATYTVYAGEDGIVSFYSGKKKTYNQGDKITSFTTNAKGVGTSDTCLPAGYKYYVVETAASDGYSLNSTKIWFKGYYDSTNGYRYRTKTSSTSSDGWTDYVSGQTVSIPSSKTVETPIYGYVEVYKTCETWQSDSSGSLLEVTEPETDAVFAVYDNATGSVVATLETSETKTKDGVEYGYAKSGVLPAGSYTLKQTAGSAYCSFITDRTFTISMKNEIVTETYTVNNPFVTYGQVQVYKAMKEADGTVSAETDATFGIFIRGTDIQVDTLEYQGTKTKNGVTYGYYQSSELPANLEYSIRQTDGSIMVSWVDDTDFTFSNTNHPSSQEVVTKTFTWTDRMNEAAVEVHKDLSCLDEDGQRVTIPEEGITFAVLKATAYAGDTYQIYDYTYDEDTKTVTLLDTTEEASAVFDSMPVDIRQAYVAALREQHTSLYVGEMVTDEDGDADFDLGTIEEDSPYILMQLSAPGNTTVCNVDCFLAKTGSSEVFSYDYVNTQYQGMVEITKTKRELATDGESYVVGLEAGAVFAVLRMDALGTEYGTSTEEIVSSLSDLSAEERQAYVDGLDVDAVAAVLTTDTGGYAMAVVDCQASQEDFIILQTAGENGYRLQDAEIWPYDYETAASHSATYYDTDEKYQVLVCVTKQMQDALGNDEGYEKNAVFYFVNAAYVDAEIITAINTMDADARMSFIAGLEKASPEAVLGSITTDAAGSGMLVWGEEECPGTFLAIQTEGTAYYSLMDVVSSKDMEATSDGLVTTYTLEGTDIGPYGYLQIYKEYQYRNDADGTDDIWKPEEGAQFIVMAEDDSIVGVITTGSDGYGTAVDPQTGETVRLPLENTYTIVQTAGCPDCEFAENGTVYLGLSNYLQTVTYACRNPATGYRLILTKTSADTDAPVNGATYEIVANEDIYAADGTLAYHAGETVAVLKTGENDATEGSDGSDDVQGESAELEPDDADPDDADAKDDSSEETESDPDQEDSTTEWPDENTETTTRLSGSAYCYLPYGSYTLKEVNSPSDFCLDEAAYTFSLDENGIYYDTDTLTRQAGTTEEAVSDGSATPSVSLDVGEEPIYGTIHVHKSGQVLTNQDAGAVNADFTYTDSSLKGAVFALYCGEDITNDAGEVVSSIYNGKTVSWTTDTEIARATTDETGYATFTWTKDGEETDQFYLGTYYVCEVTAPEGFVLDSSRHDVILSTQVVEYDEESMAEDDSGTGNGNDGPYRSTGMYVLCEGGEINAYLTQEDYGLTDITSVAFVPYDATLYAQVVTSQMGVSYDVSADGDGTVLLLRFNSSFSSTAASYGYDAACGYIMPMTADQVVFFNALSSDMFADCSNLESISFDNVDTALMVDMSRMFYKCTGLEELDLSNFNTLNVQYMAYTFYKCTNLKTIRVTDTDLVKAEEDPDGTLVEITADAVRNFTSEYTKADGSAAGAETFSFDDFRFTGWYSYTYFNTLVQQNLTDNENPEVICLTEGDIASISPASASMEFAEEWLDEEQSSFTMTVYLTLAETSPYYCTDGSRDNVIAATVTVCCPDNTVVSDERNEHPEVTVEIEDAAKLVTVRILKEDSTGADLAGASFALYANEDIYDADGDLLYTAGDEEHPVDTSVSADGCDWIEFYHLPTDVYGDEDSCLPLDDSAGTVDIAYRTDETGHQTEGTDSGHYMYYVKETAAPAGYETADTIWYLSGDLDDLDGTEEGLEEGAAVYAFTAVNEALDYLTLEKEWDDEDDAAGLRPEFVMFCATDGSGASDDYYIVLTQDEVYLLTYGSNNTQMDLFAQWCAGTVVPDPDTVRSYASWSKPTVSYTNSSGNTVWRAVLDDKDWTALNGATALISPFTVGSNYDFTEATALLDIMTKVDGESLYKLDSSGWSNDVKSVWRAVNVLATPSVATSVTKIWDDDDDAMGVRPESIYVTLKRRVDSSNKAEVVLLKQELNEANGWSLTVADIDGEELPKYSEDTGELYTYYWEEVTEGLPEGYTETETVPEYNSETNCWEMSITNSYAYTSATVRKVWDDENGSQEQPQEVYMLLYREYAIDMDGTTVRERVDLDGRPVTDADYGTDADTAVALDASTDWEATVAWLPVKTAGGAAVSYFFAEAAAGDIVCVDGKELTLPEDWLADYEVSTVYGDADGVVTNLTTVTNHAIAQGRITVTKRILASEVDWSDGEPAFSFTLTGTTTGGEEYEQTKTLRFAQEKATEGETYLTLQTSFENLAYGDYVLAESGEEYRYELEEIACDSTDAVISEEDGTVAFTLSRNADTLDVEAVYTNHAICGSVALAKVDSAGNPVGNVGFALYDADGNLCDDGQTYSDGSLVFENLLPGKYTIVETDTVDGMELLQEPLEVTVPLVLTEEEVASMEEQGISVDTEDGILYDGSWYFYHLAYTVSDSWNFDLPSSGSTSGSMKTLLLAGILLLLVVLLLLVRGRIRLGGSLVEADKHNLPQATSVLPQLHGQEEVMQKKKVSRWVRNMNRKHKWGIRTVGIAAAAVLLLAGIVCGIVGVCAATSYAVNVRFMALEGTTLNYYTISSSGSWSSTEKTTTSTLKAETTSSSSSRGYRLPLEIDTSANASMNTVPQILKYYINHMSDSDNYVGMGYPTVIDLPTLSGHTFAGWYVVKDTDGYLTMANDPVTAKLAYSVADSGSVNCITSSGSVLSNKTYTSYHEMTYVTEDVTSTSKDFYATVYPLWAKSGGARYAVTYNLNGGSYSGNPSYSTSSRSSTTANVVQQTFYYGLQQYLLTFTPSRSYYTFLGWGTSSTATTAKYASGGAVAITADTTLYAVWEPYTYTVTYNPNGASGSATSVSATYDTALTLKGSSTFSRSGYTFQEWNTKADGTGTAYAAGDSVKNLTTTNGGTVNLYAIWSANVITVHYDANGGSGAMEDSTFVYNGSTPLSANAFTRTGFTFMGWVGYRSVDGKFRYQAADGSSSGWYVQGTQPEDWVYYIYKDQANMISAATSGTVTMYAQWTNDAAGWSAADVILDTDMFAADKALTGGNGTTYDDNHRDSAYARIDGKDGSPGYLTEK